MEITYSLQELDKVAEEVLAFAKAKTLLFKGQMGAGKTTLIKAMCHQLGVTDEVSSPTFSLVNEYSGKADVLHFDLYRVESTEELYDIGFEDYLDRAGFKFIEWPEHATEFLDEYQTISIENIDPETRRLIIS